MFSRMLMVLIASSVFFAVSKSNLKDDKDLEKLTENHPFTDNLISRDGLKLVYEFSEAIQIDQQDKTNVSYKARISLTTIKKEQEETIVFVSFQLLETSKLSGSLGPQIIEKIKSHNNAHALLTLNRDRSIKSIKTKGSSTHLAFMRRIVERMSFQASEQNEWSTSESYLSRMREFNYEKQNATTYRKLHIAHDLNYEGSFKLNRHKIVISQNLFESVSSSLPSGKIRSSSLIKLALHDSSLLSSETVRKLRKEHLNLGYNGEATHNDREIDKNEPPEIDLSEVISILESSESGLEMQNAYLKALSWISFNPDKLGSLKNWFYDDDMDYKQKAVLSAALGQSGKKEAKKLMIELIEYFQLTDPGISSSIMNDFMIAKNPDAELSLKFQNLSARLKSGSLKLQSELTLGALSNELRRNKGYASKSVSHAIFLDCAKMLREAKSKREIIHAIGILGNTKNPAVESMVGDFLQSPDPLLRAEAIGAFRGLKSISSREALMKIMENEQSDELKMLAVDSFLAKPIDLSFLERLEHVLDKTASSNLRAKLIYFLLESFSLSYKDSLRGLLVRQLERESDPYLYEKLSELESRLD